MQEGPFKYKYYVNVGYVAEGTIKSHEKVLVTNQQSMESIRDDGTAVNSSTFLSSVCLQEPKL